MPLTNTVLYKAQLKQQGATQKTSIALQDGTTQFLLHTLLTLGITASIYLWSHNLEAGAGTNNMDGNKDDIIKFYLFWITWNELG